MLEADEKRRGRRADTLSTAMCQKMCPPAGPPQSQGGVWEGKRSGESLYPLSLMVLLTEVSEREEEDTPEAGKARCNIGSDVSFLLFFLTT